MFNFNMSMEQLLYMFIARTVVLLTALPIHEFAHGFVAKKLGDPTADNQGRLTLNPFAHLDPIGSICIMLTGFGWAKPVPVNPFFFKNRKAGMALSALAGPVANILLGTIALIIAKIILFWTPEAWLAAEASFKILQACYTLFSLMVSINIGLAVFNLIPVPPLDGSKILGFFLPDRINNMFYQYQQAISFVLMGLVLVGALDYPITIARNFIMGILNFLTGFIR